MRHLRTAVALTAATLFALAGAALPSAASGATSATATAPAAHSAQAAGLLPAADPTPAPKKLFSIRDERIQESSGLAKSQKHQGIYWTVNDSSDVARVFAHVEQVMEIVDFIRADANRPLCLPRNDD